MSANINIYKDFSHHPAGRTLKDCKDCGERFLNEFLQPAIDKCIVELCNKVYITQIEEYNNCFEIRSKCHSRVFIDLSNLPGVGSSFWYSSFGQLNYNIVKDIIVLSCDDDSFLVDYIWNIIKGK